MADDKFEAKKVKGKDCPEFRVSYEHILTPQAFEGNAPKYGLTMLFPKSTNLVALKRAAKNALIEKWGSDEKKWPKGLKTPFRDGDEKSDSPGYEGHIFVAATRSLEKGRPPLVDNRLQPIGSDEDGRAKFYSGCYAKATLVARTYDNKGNRGVAFSLLAVQKTRDGEHFGGSRDLSEEFEEMPDTNPYSSSATTTGDEDSQDSMGL